MENIDTNKTIDDKMKRAALRELSRSKSIFTTDGRMRRKDAIFWTIILLIFCGIILCGCRYIMGLDNPSPILSIILIIFSIIGMAAALISIIVAIKRLHDINFSGWWFLLLMFLNTILYGIPTIILLCWPGTKGPNKYGEDPREENS